MSIKIPRIYVDFNEMPEENLVLLAREDHKIDSSGNCIELHEGAYINIYSDDLNEEGNVDNLIAEGIVEKNTFTGWASSAKWCCRINAAGIRHESDSE